MCPRPFEWSNDALAIDTNGVVYATSADGNLYAINQGGALKQNIFLERAVKAAGTPLSIGADGKIYAQNFGQLVPVGN
jgi:outer membrane protein assembly factor BamB